MEGEASSEIKKESSERDTASRSVTIDRAPKHPMEALLKQRDDGGLQLKVGDIVEGVVVQRNGNRLFIDLGSRGIGVVFGREFYEAQNAIKNLKPGDTVTAKIIELESDIVEGYPELSLKEAGKERLWADLREAMQKRETLTIKAKEANRGGIIMEYNGIVGFMPVSQLSQKNYPRVEGGDKEKIFEELKKFVGKEMQVRIIGVDQNEEKLIFSEREIDDDAMREIVSRHAVGEELEGEVTAIAPFGVFVKFPDGLEGLIHVSELDWQLVQNTKDVVNVGEKVKVKIIGLDGGKVSLSLKALKEDPWAKLHDVVKKGDVVKGIVTKFNPFGAFVKLVFHLDGGDKREVQGLVHISEFGNEQKMREALEIGKEYQFMVSMVDLKEHRISLTLSDMNKEADTGKNKKEGK